MASAASSAACAVLAHGGQERLLGVAADDRREDLGPPRDDRVQPQRSRPCAARARRRTCSASRASGRVEVGHADPLHRLIDRSGRGTRAAPPRPGRSPRAAAARRSSPGEIRRRAPRRARADDDHLGALGLGDVVEAVRRRARADDAVLGLHVALLEEALARSADLLRAARACRPPTPRRRGRCADRVLLRVDGDDQRRLARRVGQRSRPA